MYNPRYMRPFVGTTIVIQDDAITPDKLDDKAVEEKHLGDDVVSERALGPSSVATSEIKDGEVKTADIGDKQVTNVKLADGIITEDKLAFVPSTRPLTPGVDTPEIQDAKVTAAKLAADAVETAKVKDGVVTAAKLAGDAVETVKIKDRNVTADKVALDSLGNEHLKADSVRGTEIQDGAVGTPELSIDAVETIKIKDFAVTEPKLTADILRKLLDGRQLLYDDFFGATLRPEWASSGDPGGSILRANSTLEIITNNVNGNKYRVNFGTDFPFSQGEKPKAFVRCLPHIPDVHIRFGFYRDDNNYILFDYDTAVDGNWHVKTKRAGAETDTDTGVAATAVMHEFFIDVQASDIVVFFIDEVSEGIHGPNIPTAVFQPFMEVRARSAHQKILRVDKFIVSTDKSVGLPPP